MKIAVLGSTGMAGHMVSLYLEEAGYMVYRASRSERNTLTSRTVDAADPAALRAWLEEVRPDGVVNCIGLLQRACEARPDRAVLLNAYIPHYLESLFSQERTKVIHLSTDCVFSGSKGGYAENALPDGRTMYDRSKALVEQWLEKYPTIRVVLDVHRDALVGSEGEIYKMVSEEAGEKVAQVMMVLGTGAGGAEHPRWRDNLAFALRLQRNLVKGYASLARPTVLRKSRYNQQLCPGYILVEVGGHGNTLSEAIAGGRLWADNVARTLLEMKQ